MYRCFLTFPNSAQNLPPLNKNRPDFIGDFQDEEFPFFAQKFVKRK